MLTLVLILLLMLLLTLPLRAQVFLLRQEAQFLAAVERREPAALRRAQNSSRGSPRSMALSYALLSPRATSRARSVSRVPVSVSRDVGIEAGGMNFRRSAMMPTAS